MSLVKRPALTPQKLEANQANALISQGPVTAGGIEGIRYAHLRHGSCSKSAADSRGSAGSGIPRVIGERRDPLRRGVARAVRLAPLQLRAHCIADISRPTSPAAVPQKHEITSTNVSWNVQFNQQHRPKTGARSKAGMSFRINKTEATSSLPQGLDRKLECPLASIKAPARRESSLWAGLERKLESLLESAKQGLHARRGKG
jgi:hypothetical protein